jgi:hypothetical protein
MRLATAFRHNHADRSLLMTNPQALRTLLLRRLLHPLGLRFRKFVGLRIIDRRCRRDDRPQTARVLGPSRSAESTACLLMEGAVWR